VVGYSIMANGDIHGFLYNNGTMTDLGAVLGGSYGNAKAINDDGQVVGGARTSSGQGHAFLYKNGVATDLGTLQGGSGSTAYAVNSIG
jgi:probable HAF family extracellular repeat protein